MRWEEKDRAKEYLRPNFFNLNLSYENNAPWAGQSRQLEDISARHLLPSGQGLSSRRIKNPSFYL